MVQNVLLWLGSGVLSYAIWAFVMRGDDAFPFKTAKGQHLVFLLIFLAVGWFGLAYWFLTLFRRFLDL